MQADLSLSRAQKHSEIYAWAAEKTLDPRLYLGKSNSCSRRSNYSQQLLSSTKVSFAEKLPKDNSKASSFEYILLSGVSMPLIDNHAHSQVER